MKLFGKKNNETNPVQPEKTNEQPTLMDNAATISGYTSDPFAPGIVLGRGHKIHKTEQATDIGEVIRDEIQVVTGEKKR